MAKHPNILVFMADQLRADALGCYGNKVCQTPNLDALAASGVVFENSLSPNPICVPARAALTTGNYPHICTGNKGNSGLIREDQVKIAEHFASCGYETYACGKLHYVPYSPPGKPRLLHGFQHCDLNESGRLQRAFDPEGKLRGLDDYVDYLIDVGWPGYSRAHGAGQNDVRPCPTPLPAEHYIDHWVADRTIEHLREHMKTRRDKPFFIFCSFPKPHTSLDPPAEFVALYDPREIPAPLGDETLLADRSPGMERSRYTHNFTTLSPAAMKVIKMYYYALITFQDAQVARVLQALEIAGVADDTIVVYTADHGDMMGDFGTYFKGNFLKGSAHVPIIIKAPGTAPARRKQPVGLQDILPTLAALTRCPLPKEVQGIDLSPALQDENAPIRELYYGSCGGPPGQKAMVFDGRWKYCYTQTGPTEELYDLAEDPDELVNLASRPDAEKLLKPWRKKLIAEARRLGDTDILDGDSLATAPLDRSGFKDLPLRGINWRWF